MVVSNLETHTYGECKFEKPPQKMSEPWVIIIENVPARVNVETGEQLFSPETVERLQRIVWQRTWPQRVIQVPVYEYV